MSKAFGDSELEQIRLRLIESCRACWTRYGYRKTNVAQIAEMSDISTGAFYRFFPTKELLFLETAVTYEKEMEETFHEIMLVNPDKTGIAASLRAIVAKMREMPWLSSMWEDWPVIMRRLPPDFMQKDFTRDRDRIARIASQYGLKPRRSIEEVTRIIDILLASVSRLDFIPGDTSASVDFIIDAVVDKLF